MAKSKKKKQVQQTPSLSPELYMKRVMRKLPVEKCYVNPSWQDNGMAQVVVVRRRPDGKFAFVGYLTDTYCLGVKDVFYDTRIEEYELQKLLEEWENRIGIEECSYAEAHNIVYGAIEFASEGGIEPCREWTVAQYGLEEDTDDIELIDYEFGLNGKHYLFTQTESEARRYEPILRKNLGDNFDMAFELGYDDDYSFDDRFKTYDEVPYAEPDYSGYPEQPALIHPEVGEILSRMRDEMIIEPQEMDALVAIDRDELIADLIEYGHYILRIHYEGDDDAAPDSLFLSGTLATALADSRLTDTLLDYLRLDMEGIEFFFGDMYVDVVGSALGACAANDLDKLEAFLNEPAISWLSRSVVIEALELILDARRDQVTGIIGRQLESLPQRVKELITADPAYAATLMTATEYVTDPSFEPLIKNLFDVPDGVEISYCGDYDEVMSRYGKKTLDIKQYAMSEICNKAYGLNHNTSEAPYSSKELEDRFK